MQASEVVEVLRVLLHGLYWTDPVLPIASPQAADLDDLQVRRPPCTSQPSRPLVC